MDVQKIARAVRVGRLLRPGNRADLRRWVSIYAGLQVGGRAVCDRHAGPLDYLEHVFFEREGEAVVWACRGGGKTMIGAVATLLDMLFKPGIQVRILGGSREQSEKMYAYLCDLVKGGFEDLVLGRMTKKGFGLTNGSRVEILAQSLKAVRGTRVQKLRCDEIELFDEEVWRAAQLTTRSMTEMRTTKREARNPGKLEVGSEKLEDGILHSAIGTQHLVRGTVEVFSTMHVPGGLMQRIVEKCEVGSVKDEGGEGGNANDETRNAKPGENCLLETGNLKLETQSPALVPQRRVFSWCIWDVIARCHPRRKCEGCILWDGCRGRAREADGFVPVEDVIAMRKRVSAAVWESEMLCRRPYLEERVFWGFSRGVHVRAMDLSRGQPAVGERLSAGGRAWICEGVIAGVDFGWNCFVCLWMVMLRDAAGGERGIWVVDEYVGTQKTLEAHVAEIKGRAACTGAVCAGGDALWKPLWVHCDVAGSQHDAHSGNTSLAILRRTGFAVRASAMRIEEGIEAINAMMGGEGKGARGEGEAGNANDETRNAKRGGNSKLETGNSKLSGPRFLVSPACVRLIAALEGYRRGADGRAVKDGTHDHLIDALRYGVMNLERGAGIAVSVY